MKLIDTHAHLDLMEQEEPAGDVLARAGEAGVDWVLCAGTTLAASRRCVELAREFPGRLFASAGIHPNYCAQAGPQDFDEIEDMARLPEVVAIGETGLDYHWDYSPPRAQADSLRRHVRLAREVAKPLIIHARKSDEDVLAILEEVGEPIAGVRHCFDGSAQIAARYVALGFHVAVGGTLTQPGHKKLKAAAAAIAADRILIETDCPFMLPAGVRKGTRNEPAFLTHIAGALAEVRGATAEEVAALTSANAERLFRGAE